MGHDWPLRGFVLILSILHHSLEISFQTYLSIWGGRQAVFYLNGWTARLP